MIFLVTCGTGTEIFFLIYPTLHLQIQLFLKANAFFDAYLNDIEYSISRLGVSFGGHYYHKSLLFRGILLFLVF